MELCIDCQKNEKHNQGKICQECKIIRHQKSNKKWRQSEQGKEKLRKANKKWKIENLEHIRIYQRNRRENLREQIYAHYGKQCYYCGAVELLQIDHVYGDGAKKRKERYGRNWSNTWAIMNEVITQGFPNIYQILCKTCNNAKSNLTPDEFYAWLIRITESKWFQNQTRT